MYRASLFLACANPELSRRIRTLLTKEGYQVIGESGESSEVLRRVRTTPPDVTILEEDMPGSSDILRILIDDCLGAVILLTSGWTRDLAGTIADGGVVSFIIRPVRVNNLLAAIESCLAASRRVQLLEQQIIQLRATLETRKLVEKAKGILMQSLGISEAEAYRRIQKQSMDHCKSMQAIAEAIILAHELNN